MDVPALRMPITFPSRSTIGPPWSPFGRRQSHLICVRCVGGGDLAAGHLHLEIHQRGGGITQHHALCGIGHIPFCYFQVRQRSIRLHLDQRNVILRIDGDDAGRLFRAIIKPHAELTILVVHDVPVRDDVTIRRDEKSAAISDDPRRAFVFVVRARCPAGTGRLGGDSGTPWCLADRSRTSARGPPLPR